MAGFKGDAPGVGLAWCGPVAAYAFGDGRVRVGDRTVRAHEGGLAVAQSCPTGKAILTAGDDGRVARTDAQGQVSTLLDLKGAWIDAMAIAAGRLAVSVGRKVHVALLDAPLEVRVLETPKAAAALAFDASGRLLAASHAAGATVFDLDAPDAPPRQTQGSGGGVSVAISPDGAYVLAGTAEPALTGWRLMDGQGFRMANFPGKPLSLAWVDGGRVLLSSGGPALLAWPFTGPNGPMGEAAGVYRPRLGLCTAVAAHGSRAAAGWSDGGVDLVGLDTGRARHLAGPSPPKDLSDDPRDRLERVSGLAFSPDGRKLAWTREDGACGLVRL